MKLKVVTLNLWNGGRLLDQAVAFLQAEQPDLLVLQEVYNGHDPTFEARFRTKAVLESVFPDFFSVFNPVYQDTRSKEGPIDDGQLILSRFPLQPVAATFLDLPYSQYSQDDWDDWPNFPALVQVALLDVDGHPVRVLNVHGPVWYAGEEVTDRRLKLREVILDQVAEADSANQALIVAGDFNAQITCPIFDDLAKHLNPVLPAGSVTTTFNMAQKTNPGYATAPVDNIFVSPDISIRAAECPLVDVSDHLPVVAELELV